MTQEQPTPDEKLADPLNELVERVSELTSRDRFDRSMLESVYRLREALVEPICRVLEEQARKPLVVLLRRYYEAVEEYVVFLPKEPDGRAERLRKVEAAQRRVRRELLPGRDTEGEVERLLDDIREWQWQTTIDESGRIAFASPSGAVVPARSNILREAGPEMIAQAVKAQHPYSDEVRPRDSNGDPGGLVVIRGAKRLIVVGDLHGRYDTLERLIRENDNLKSVIEGSTHLVFLGDAVHPRGRRIRKPTAYEESFCVMLLIMTLKAENPDNVHYILGNHDNAHVGGVPLLRGGARPDVAFEQFFMHRLSASVVEEYREFVRSCPVAIRIHAVERPSPSAGPSGWAGPAGAESGGSPALLLVHATLSGMLIDSEALINIFRKGRRSEELEELLWGRQFDEVWIRRGAAAVGAKFVIGGHTIPTGRHARALGFEPIAPPAFGKVGDVQLIVDSQCDTAGYLDVDLTRPLPNDVAKLLAPDGRSALKIIEH